MSILTTLLIVMGDSISQLITPTISITSQSESDITLDWNDIANSSGYIIEYATDNSFSSGVVSDTVTSHTKTYTDLALNTYFFRVKALGDNIATADSDWSITASADIDVPFSLTSATYKTVKADGSIGVDCDYTSITSALTAITDNSSSKQYVLTVKNGVYNENGTFDDAFGFYVGMTLKHYVHIIGESKEGVIINGPQANTQANEVLVDVFHIPATCLIKNITVNAQNCKYCFHCDYNSGNYEYSLYIKDCNLNHFGSRTGYNNPIGCGMHGNQSVNVINTMFTTGGGFYAHGEISNQRDLSKHFEILLKNCITDFLWQDYIEYAPNTITLTNNTFNILELQTITNVYNANPGDPTCNTGTKVYTTFINSGNTVTSVIRDTETANILGTTMDAPSDFV